MTEQEKQELIKECQDEIESLKWRLFRTYSTGGCPDYLNSCLKRQELALASLTAPPVNVAAEIKMPEDLVEHKSGLYGHMPTLTLQTPDWAEGYREALMDVKLLNE